MSSRGSSRDNHWQRERDPGKPGDEVILQSLHDSIEEYDVHNLKLTFAWHNTYQIPTDPL